MLSEFLVSELFVFFLIFCRLGAAVMVMPGIGEAFVTSRARLLFAVMFALALTPALSPLMPKFPSQPVLIITAVLAEVFIGIFFGAMARMLLSAIHTAGTVIATQSGLATAVILDISQTTQSTSVSNLLSLLALALIFATNTHHLMLRALMDSYALFPPATFPPLADAAQYAMQNMAHAFRIAAQLSSPHIVAGLVVYFASGVLSRLMPQLQIFFLVMAPQILFAFYILIIVLSGIMLWYIDTIQESFATFLQ